MVVTNKLLFKVLVTALLESVSKYAVWAYTTPGSAVTYQITPPPVLKPCSDHRLHGCLLCDVGLQPKVVKAVPVQAECGLKLDIFTVNVNWYRGVISVHQARSLMV